ncbi:biosynthetic arginine decarboxylase [Algisphaera agarilytica]|uniref:Biosynthetic arginine decarboxylase n=1 Tax=Algisphaera agarilytica TaxID=1385975 RepID=A0A7X0H8F1_9BACT|nr:biosynthetic arginine decarboxylase [Algisphaera agarilytica]MBB6431195.1 arginine decarboxylase [Algisphaera agarilytica]
MDKSLTDSVFDHSEQDDAAAWTVQDAIDFYGPNRWGNGYFGVSETGHVTIRPGRDSGPSLDLWQLVQDLRQRDVSTPMLLRFPGILEDRLKQIADAFRRAIEEFDYAGQYRGVYPIKVNQQRHIVEELLNYGSGLGFGLEAGSKPELLAVMALAKDPDSLVICNGFKDQKFIEAVILSRKLGKNVIPVVEKFSELQLIIEQAKAHDVRPAIGLRIKLASSGSGRWHGSGGERSKFGLFISEVLDAVRLLKDEGMLDCLELVHFHLGSQISDMRALKSALVESARMYVELAKLGAGLKYLDVGGGLGIDYDGSKSGNESSPNYTLTEYANNVVYHIGEVCQQAEIPAPTIITESGRAMAAHHSVLVMDVLGWSGFDRFEPIPRFDAEALAELPEPVRTLYETHEALSNANLREYFHDAQVAREQTLSLFSLGYCSLEHRGLAERLFYGICSNVYRLAQSLDPVPQEFAALETLLSDIYFCNGSVFQSLPDCWAIDQLFPVMPIQQLDEKPTCRGVLADITCDSDGKIDRFAAPPESGKTSVPVLPLHPYTGGDYFLGVFLVGAYQETLGDLHNLFGDTNAVHVTLDEQGQVQIDEIVEGDTVAEVLRYVQFEPEELRRTFRKTLEQAVREGKITVAESGVLRRFYEQGLSGYTYLT